MAMATMAALRHAPATAVLPVVDYERAKRFYTGTLGLDVTDEPGAPGSGFVTAGEGTKILLYQHERTKADHTVVNFWVSDIDDLVRGLRDRGVTFLEYDMSGLKTVGGIADLGGERAAWFTDTEGNILALGEMH